MDIFDDLPARFYDRGFRASHGEWAWPAVEATQLVDHFTGLSVAVVGVEVWIPGRDGAVRIPAPMIYAWDGGRRQSGETWPRFVARVSGSAKHYVDSFEWAPEDEGKYPSPYFNLTTLTETEYLKYSR